MDQQGETYSLFSFREHSLWRNQRFLFFSFQDNVTILIPHDKPDDPDRFDDVISVEAGTGTGSAVTSSRKPAAHVRHVTGTESVVFVGDKDEDAGARQVS